MVIELSGVQFGLKSYQWKSDERSAWVRFEMTSMILDHNLLHSTQFNYHFITAILKSQNSVSTNILLIK